MRKVMGCRVSLSPEAALELGKICFRHVFESEEEDGRPWETMDRMGWKRLNWEKHGKTAEVFFEF